MANTDFRILGRYESVQPETFTASTSSTKDIGWTVPTPTFEFQRLSAKTISFPTYKDSGPHKDVHLTINGAPFAVPVYPRGQEFSHEEISGCHICETCEEVEIEKLFTRGHGRRYQMGWSDRILSCKNCSLCQIITAALQHEYENGYPAELTTFEGPETEKANLLELPMRCFVILTSWPSASPIPTGREAKYHIYCYFLHWNSAALMGDSTIRLLEKDASRLEKTPQFCGRIIDPAKADLKLGRSWLFDCDHNHDCLFQDEKKTGVERLLVIDVHKECLVELPPGSIYLALSYVWPHFHRWPDFKVLQLRKGNLDFFKEPGYLSKMQKGLPRVIQDAFQIVRDLDETYIWIDALCIVQDDPPVQQELIKRMDEVYGKAYLTIVVGTSADPSEDYSIPGVGIPRSIPQKVETVEGLQLVAAHPDYNRSLQKSRWVTRGWTFQEGLLSKRCLIFTDHQMYFRCIRDARCEDVVSELGTENYQGHPARPIRRESKIDYLLNSEFFQRTNNQDWFGEYVRIVRDYSKRNLTIESDILKAFTGIMNKLSPYIDGTGFMCGHPFSRFEKSLLWYPTSRARRRTVHVQSHKHEYPFPSWSWVGWVGGVDYEVDRPGSVPVLQEHLPTVQWFRWSEYGLVPTHDSWHLYRPPKADSSSAFELSLLWRYRKELEINKQCIISWGTTVKRRLQLPEVFICEWVTDWDQSLPCFIIQDTDGEACGFMPSVDREWAHTYKNAGGGDCELLILSVTEKTADDLRQGESFLHTKYRTAHNGHPYFLNVMLIEIDDNGIAYRRGIGLMHVSAVDFMNLLSVERKIIILG